MQAVDQRGPAGGAGKNGRIGPYEKEYFEAWPLERAFPGKPSVNRGISGQTTSQLLLRLH